MPQLNPSGLDDPYGLGLKPATAPYDPYDLGLKPATPQPKQPSSFLGEMASWPNLVRTVGSITGDVLGTAAAPFTMGLGYPVLSAGFGAGAEGIARYMEGQPFNPYIMGVEGLLNLAPGPKIPGAGAGLREIGEFALKSGVYGAGQAAAGSIPRHIAETGQFELPSLEETAGQTAGGAIGGTAFGGLLGAGSRLYHGPGISAAAPPPIEPPSRPIQGLETPPLAVQPQLPETRIQQPPYMLEAPPIEGPELGPYGAPTSREQPRLPYRGIPAPEVPPSAESPIGIRGQLGDPLITITHPSAGLTQYLRTSGYVEVPDLRNPQTGEMQMARADIAGVYRKTEPLPPTRETMPGPIPEGQMGVIEGQDLIVPTNKINVDLIRNYEENGYKLVKQDSATGLFKKFIGEDRGSFSHTEMIENLTRLLGREPTPEEVERGMARQPIPGEQTGRVAPFDAPPKYANLYEISEVLKGKLREEGVAGNEAEIDDLINQAENYIGNYKTASQARTDYVEINRLVDNAANDSEAEFFQSIADSIKEKGNQLDAIETAEGRPQFVNPQTGQPTELPSVSPDRSYVWMDDQLVPKSSLGPRLVEGLRERSQLERIGEAPPQEGIDLNVPPEAMYRPEDDVQRMARTPEGKAIFSTDVVANAIELTHRYQSPLPHIMAREGVANSKDAILGMGDKGVVKVKINYNPYSLEISDNGRGMTPDELYTVYTTLHKSGKGGEAEATGGKGVGKASFVLGGKHFEIVTVAEVNGKKIESSFSGEPHTFLPQGYDKNGNPVGGFDIKERVVPKNTPTGTTFKTMLKDNQYPTYSDQAMEKIIKYSRDIDGKIILDTPLALAGEHNLKAKPGDTPIARNINIDGANNKADITIPENTKIGTYQSIKIEMLNNGLWQYTNSLSLREPVNGIPERVIVNLKPQVDEFHENYPFGTHRESVSDRVAAEIDKRIVESIVNPMGANAKKDLNKLWNQMPTTPAAVGGTVRDTVFFDPGDRLTAEESTYVQNSWVIREAQKSIDEFLNTIITNLGLEPVKEKLVRTGIYMPIGRYEYGIHIPNPGQPKAQSAILVNFFANIQDHPKDPATAALKTIVTMLHESAHIGVHNPDYTPIRISDLSKEDPRLGDYLVTYLNEVINQGGADAGHGMPFIRRLGEVYATTGSDAAFDAADKLESIFTGGKFRGYSPEIQELLRIHEESRGRSATTEDILSGTGIKRADTGGTGEETILGDNQTDGVRVPFGERVKQATGWGMGGAVKQDAKFNWLKEALAVPTNATTMGDFSFPGRQGLSMVLTPEFWKAFPAMFKGFLSEKGFKQIDDELNAKRIMQRPQDPVTFKLGKSFAQEAGIKTFRPASEGAFNKRAPAVAARWLETGGNIPYLSAAYRNTIGVPIRMTNRAYITFANYLNVNRFEKLANLMQDMSLEALQKGEVREGIMPWKTKFSPEQAMDLNPYKNLVRARELADFTNTATGHGPLKTHILPFKQTEVSFEKAAGVLNHVMFAPGLFFSRVRMLNPSTYIMATPFVRKQYLKAALSMGAAWYVFTEAAKMAGGDEVEVNNQITNADFGKVRIGNTRMDPGGGFLQFLTAYGRLYNGGYTSSASGEYHQFGQGFQAETQLSNAQRFMSNKLNPVAKFAYDLANQSEYNPFHVGDRTVQLFVPLIVQDAMEIVKQDNPDLIPWLIPVMFGMGTQSYSKGESTSRLIPSESDWLAGGGGLADIIPGREDEGYYGY